MPHLTDANGDLRFGVVVLYMAALALALMLVVGGCSAAVTFSRNATATKDCGGFYIGDQWFAKRC